MWPRLSRALVPLLLLAAACPRHRPVVPPGQTSTLLPALMGGFMLLLGTLFILIGLKTLAAARTTLRWPTSPGKVLSTEVSDFMHTSSNADGGRDYQRMFVATVRYSYELKGTTLESRGVRLEGDTFNLESSAREMIARYPVGRSVLVYRDPNNPERTVLEPGVHPSSWLPIPMGAVAVVGGVLFLVFGVWR